MKTQKLGLTLLLFAGVYSAFAGGFYLTLGNPAVSSDAKAKHAFVTVRADGCHNPENAQISAVAEGVINGKRQTVPLKLTALSAPGAYAIHRAWPAEGAWVVSVTAKHTFATAGAVIPVTRDGFDRSAATIMQGAPPAAEIEAALQRAAVGQMQAKR